MGVEFRAETKNPEKGWWERIDGTLSADMSNANAGTVLAALGLDLAPDYCGSISPDEFDERFDRWLTACEQGRGSEFERSAYRSGGPGTGRCTVISAGMDFSSLSDRMNMLARIAGAARAHGGMLGWA